MKHVSDLKIHDLNNGIHMVPAIWFYENYYTLSHGPSKIETIEQLQERVPFCYTEDLDKAFLIKTDGDKIIASLTMKYFTKENSYHDHDFLSMMAIGVDEDYRHQGHAKDLMDAFFDIAKENNVEVSHSHWEPDGKKYLQSYWEQKEQELSCNTGFRM